MKTNAKPEIPERSAGFSPPDRKGEEGKGPALRQFSCLLSSVS